MDKYKYLVAVASSDEIVVNTHFGKADTFLIYGILEDNSFEYIERRALKPVCEGGDHDEGRLIENAQSLKDCAYVLVSRIGPRAVNILEANGITAMEIPDIIDNALNKIISYDEIQKLFE
ncbi:MAG: dinitrogenase iron-molybdenum cofactor biosynthesis protein [Lachnospiraceae bacterium]|nr:dinitrogenase iron-molybdenum cofactor biosynthesis protein [Lachnospiraceae bacterium]